MAFARQVERLRRDVLGGEVVGREEHLLRGEEAGQALVALGDDAGRPRVRRRLLEESATGGGVLKGRSQHAQPGTVSSLARGEELGTGWQVAGLEGADGNSSHGGMRPRVQGAIHPRARATTRGKVKVVFQECFVGYKIDGITAGRLRRMNTDTLTVEQASAHVYEALTHHFGPLDLGANQPLVKAISEYGQRSREGDEEKIHEASAHIWQVLSHHQERLDLGANDPLVKALAEYGEACRREGVQR
jgi:hypothetical protein